MTLASSAPSSQVEKNRRALMTEHLMEDLGRRTAWGGAVAIGAQITRFALQLVSSAIMARLLAPEDFGLVAMAATITGFVGIFADLGLSVATVQRKELDQDTVSALFLVNMGVAFLIMIIAFVAAPVAAWGFGDERVRWVMIALAPQIILAAAGAQHSALLQRGMFWMTIQWTGIAAQIGGAVVGITLAWRTDIGYWALVAQGLTGMLFSLVLLWTVCPWRPSMVGQWAKVRPALTFGLNLTGFNLVNYFHRQFDNVLIGWRWGAGELGFYTRAYALLLLPLSLINGPVGSAVIPALSRLQGDAPRWRRTFLEALGAVVLISSGLTAMLIATAGPLVTLLYGPSWSETARIFQYLAISMFAGVPANTMGWIYISLDRTKRMFRWSLMSTPIIVAAFLVGLPFGAAGLALAYSIASWLLAIPCLAFAARRSPVSTSAMLRVIAMPTTAGIISTFIGLAVVPVRSSTTVITDVVEIVGATGSAYFIGALAIVMLDPAFRSLRTRIIDWVSSRSGRSGR